jgi:hypothetical protein
VISLTTLAILTALFLVGFEKTSISPIEADNTSFQLIKFLPKAGLKNSFSGDANITIVANDAYADFIFTSNMDEINYN